MTLKRSRPKANVVATDDVRFHEASTLWESGQAREAFVIFRELATSGDAGAQVNVGNMLDAGDGTRRNWPEARRWYLRAVAGGHPSGAINLGVHYRMAGKRASALRWFHRAVQMGDDSACLQIAKYFVLRRTTVGRARTLLKRVSKSAAVSERDREEALALLRSG